MPVVMARQQPGVLSAWPATQLASVAGPRPAAATTPGMCPPATAAPMISLAWVSLGELISPAGMLAGLAPGNREGMSLMYGSLKSSGIS